MVNKNKTHRLMIQVTLNQYNWLSKKAQSLDISISQLIRWLLNKKIKDIHDIKILENKPKEAIEKDNRTNEQDWNEMMEELDKCNPSNKDISELDKIF